MRLPDQRQLVLRIAFAIAGTALVIACGSSPSPAGSVDGGGDDGADAVAGHGADAVVVVAAPDLRFKWVGSSFTLRVHELTNGGSGGPGTLTITGPFGVGPLDLTGEGSSEYDVFSTSERLEPMVVIATTGSLPSVDDDLAGLLTTHSVVVSLDATPSDVTFKMATYNALLSGTRSSLVSYLPYARGSLAPADFPAWVSSQGSIGRVVTAVCPKDGALFATAFGRMGDTVTYETQVVTSALDGLEAQLATLASGGYVITAFGRDGTGSDGAGGFVAVGTRVAGQTSARSIKIIDQPCIVNGPAPDSPVQTLFDDGYAIVGEIFHNPVACNGAPTWAFIGER